MEKSDEQFIFSLLDKDPELRRHYDEHLELEKRLQAYQDRPYLNSAEEMEKKRLQKLKLIGKDKIMEILGRYRQGAAQRGA